MKIALNTLVAIILSAVTLVLIIMISSVFSDAAGSTEEACTAAVRIQTTLASTQTPADTDLSMCTTKQEMLTGTQNQMKQQLAQAYARCHRMFRPALSTAIIKQEDVYCHVCAIYTTDQPLTLHGFSGALDEEAKRLYGLEPMQLDSDEYKDLDIQETVSVMFLQDRTEELTLWNALLPQEWTAATIGAVTAGALATVFTGGAIIPIAAVGAGAATGFVAGQFIPHPDGWLASAIVIRNHDKEHIEQLGCTTIDPTN